MPTTGITSLLWFVAIIALIPLALWLLKRTPMGGANAPGVMRSVGSLMISSSQRIVTVEVGQGEHRRWLVLGVTPQNISTLHTMEPQSEPLPQSAGVVPLPFAALLGKLRQDKGSAGER